MTSTDLDDLDSARTCRGVPDGASSKVWNSSGADEGPIPAELIALMTT